MKTTQAKSFSLTYAETGKTYKWTFWRESKPSQWMLKDHEGYVRTGPSTWIDFVPFVHLVADNYGMTCKIS